MNSNDVKMIQNHSLTSTDYAATDLQSFMEKLSARSNPTTQKIFEVKYELKEHWLNLSPDKSLMIPNDINSYQQQLIG